MCRSARAVRPPPGAFYTGSIRILGVISTTSPSSTTDFTEATCEFKEAKQVLNPELLDRRSSSSSRATTRTGPRSPGRRGLRAGDKASGHWRPQLIYGTGCVLKEDTCEAGDHGLSAPSGAPMAWGISCSLGDSTSQADPTSQKPHEEAHLTEFREVATTWRTDFELGKALRARQGGQQGRWCLLC